MNRVEIMGFIGKEPSETNGVLRFSVATNRKQKNGENKTLWHDIVAFGTTAEFIKKYFHGGEPIIIFGELDYYIGETDGKKIKYTSIIAQNVEFPLSKKNNDTLSQEREIAEIANKGVDDKVKELEIEINNEDNKKQKKATKTPQPQQSQTPTNTNGEEDLPF